MADIFGRDGIPLAVNQVEFSILRQLPEKSGLLAEMKKRGITCLACTHAPQLTDDLADHAQTHPWLWVG